MRKIRNGSLPERFRNAWPVVYAVRNRPPYAYLMEYFPSADGWQSLEDRFYPKPGALPIPDAQAVRLVNTVLDILFMGYDASWDERTLPSLNADYVSRIQTRLVAAANLDPRFRSQPLSINGTPFEPWKAYLDLLTESASFLGTITPPFSTVVHGDPNPGNLLLRTDSSTVEVKLIDPKEWQTGDYLFDIAKLTHFVEATGPIEKPHPDMPLSVSYTDNDGSAELAFRFGLPTWTRPVVDACLSRAEIFAAKRGDKHWAARYELGMAANLLGLPEGRLKKGRPEAALALYGEGIHWLAKFCARLRGSLSVAKHRAPIAPRSELEPEPLAHARVLVRAHAPQVRAGEDRRGFQTLHWEPTRSNREGKPAELSLEHEARLMPTSSDGLAALHRRLSNSEGKPLGALIVKRYARSTGFQSIDRYWDLKDAHSKKRLIPRMLSLRERVKTSEFMTWTTSDEVCALNLELPLVALEKTGVIVRLEFNWIDKLALTLDEFRASSSEGPTANPIGLAARIVPIGKSAFEPVIEHTTFREKYGLHVTGKAGEIGPELFQLNIDHVVAQSLRNHRIASYTDIDIAPSRAVDAELLESLIEFSQTLASSFELVPIGATKVWRDALVTGELDS